MAFNFSDFFSFMGKNVNASKAGPAGLARKKLGAVAQPQPGAGTIPASPATTPGNPVRPDPSIEASAPSAESFGQRVRAMFTGGNGASQPVPGGAQDGDYAGIPQKNIRLANGLAALSHAVNPKGSGRDLMAVTSGMLEESARSGERAREVMRQDNLETKRRQEEVEDMKTKRSWETEDDKTRRSEKTEDYRTERSDKLSDYERKKKDEQDWYIKSGEGEYKKAMIARAKERPDPSEYERFRSSLAGTTNPATNKPYTEEDIFGKYKSYSRKSESNGFDEKEVIKNASAELKSFGAFLDTDEGSIDFPEGKAGAINSVLKKHGITFYPEKAQNTKGMKRYYLGGYNNQGQTGATFNLDDYLPK